MSLKAVDAASEGTNGVGRGGGTNVRLKPAAADDINRTVEQSRDAILERDVFIDADQGRRSGTPIRAVGSTSIMISMSLSGRSSPCARAEQRRVTDAARAKPARFPAAWR